MLTFRDLSPNDQDRVLPMVMDFYQSDAVDHLVDRAVMERAFLDAVDPAEDLLHGLLIQYGGEDAGYLYLTKCYSAEVGGRCVFIEELYLNPPFRGRGLGEQILSWIEESWPGARRFRLEVTQVNQRATHLYQKMGYQFLRYNQMVLDKAESR